MKLKKYAALILALVLALSAAAAIAEADASVDAILAKGTFILGLDDSFPPMGFRDENNDIVGFDIDVAAEVCKRLGVELVLQPIDWSSKELELSTGNIDCIWNGMSITPDREESMSMTFPYLNNTISIFTKAGSDITDIASLVGKKVAVQSASTADELFAGDMAEVAKTFEGVYGFDEYLTALMDLQQGGVDAVAIDVVVGEYKIHSMGADDIVEAFSISDDNYGVGFRKGDVALRDKVEELLIAMKADGALAAISEKWFGTDITVVPAK